MINKKQEADLHERSHSSLVFFTKDEGGLYESVFFLSFISL